MTPSGDNSPSFFHDTDSKLLHSEICQSHSNLFNKNFQEKKIRPGPNNSPDRTDSDPPQISIVQVSFMMNKKDGNVS